MQLHLADYALWFASPLIEFVVAVLMYRRRLHEDYFWFFGYVVLGVVSNPILFILRGQSYTLYYYGYYVNLGLAVLLGVGVLHDVLINTFISGRASRRLFAVLVLGSAAVWALGLLGVLNQSGGTLMDLLFVTDRGVRFVSCLLLLVLYLLGWRWRLSLKSLPFGIALGYGGFALVNLFVFLVLPYRAGWKQASLSRLNSFAYCLGTLVWLRYVIWARDRDGNPMPPAHRAGSARSRSVMYRIVPRGQRFLRDMADGFSSQEVGASAAARSRLARVPTSRQ